MIGVKGGGCWDSVRYRPAHVKDLTTTKTSLSLSHTNTCFRRRGKHFQVVHKALEWMVRLCRSWLFSGEFGNPNVPWDNFSFRTMNKYYDIRRVLLPWRPFTPRAPIRKPVVHDRNNGLRSYVVLSFLSWPQIFGVLWLYQCSLQHWKTEDHFDSLCWNPNVRLWSSRVKCAYYWGRSRVKFWVHTNTPFQYVYLCKTNNTQTVD